MSALAFCTNMQTCVLPELLKKAESWTRDVTGFSIWMGLGCAWAAGPRDASQLPQPSSLTGIWHRFTSALFLLQPPWDFPWLCKQNTGRVIRGQGQPGTLYNSQSFKCSQSTQKQIVQLAMCFIQYIRSILICYALIKRPKQTKQHIQTASLVNKTKTKISVWIYFQFLSKSTLSLI